MPAPLRIDTVDLASTRSAYYAPATIAPESSRLIHISGQPGSTRNGQVPDDYETQIHLALLNLRKIILKAGASIRDIVKLNLYIVNYDASRRQHARHIQKFCNGHRPAITLLPVTALAVPSWVSEVDAVVALASERLLPPAGFSQTTDEHVDVVIIGPGLAGLSAAQDAIKAGLSCVVLEARDRVGGKTWSQDNIDLGAAWINDTNQSKIYALAKRFGAEIIEQNTTGNCVLQDETGKISTFPWRASKGE